MSLFLCTSQLKTCHLVGSGEVAAIPATTCDLLSPVTLNHSMKLKHCIHSNHLVPFRLAGSSRNTCRWGL